MERSTEWLVHARECVGALWLACHEGRLDVAQWICRSASLNTGDVALEASRALRAALDGGHLELAQWIESTYPARDVPRMTTTLRRACRAGRVDVARWVAERFRLTARDVRESNAFVEACRAGHLETAQWLAEAFELSANYMLMTSGATEAAARAPHTSVVDWLQTRS